MAVDLTNVDLAIMSLLNMAAGDAVKRLFTLSTQCYHTGMEDRLRSHVQTGVIRYVGL